MKRQLRRRMLSRIASRSLWELRRRSLRLQKKFLRLKSFKNAKCICVYVSLPREAGTRLIIQRSLKAGKRVLVPLADVKTKRLRFYEIKSTKTDLKKGAYGILEPRAGKAKPAGVREANLVVVPGTVFDRQNHRLGRGAGFYDRFLEKVGRNVSKIGLAFSFQIVKRVPRAWHDQKLDLVITD